MQELKPVAWHTEDEKNDMSATTYDEDIAIRWRMKGWPVTPMFYAIPDTHRIVPVELLNGIMELAGVALVYQPFGTKDRQNFDALMAIIEEKP